MKRMTQQRVLVAAAMIMVSMAVAQAATYIIGWHENPDLSAINGKILSAGDQLVFSYTGPGATLYYNVIKVDLERYNKCNGVGPTVYHSGNDSFTLDKGSHYFICGASTHCLNSSMKLDVYAS